MSERSDGEDVGSSLHFNFAFAGGVSFSSIKTEDSVPGFTLDHRIRQQFRNLQVDTMLESDFHDGFDMITLDGPT